MHNGTFRLKSPRKHYFIMQNRHFIEKFAHNGRAHNGRVAVGVARVGIAI